MNAPWDIPALLVKTVLLRPYVFFFLVAAAVAAVRTLGWKRAGAMFGLTWVVAFACEWASTRTGVPFGEYAYTASTAGEELYISNIPFIVPLSFPFLMYASYCLALLVVLPRRPGPAGHLLWREPLSWSVIGLTCVLLILVDVVIDPVTLLGDRWFLGRLYEYSDPGVYFGVPLANFAGWGLVGALAMAGYRWLDRHTCLLPGLPDAVPVRAVLPGCGVYYGALLFSLVVTFGIGEWVLGVVGCVIHAPVAALALLKMRGWRHAPLQGA